MRKKLATKICAIVMTAAMVAGMAGCGGDDGGSSQGGNSQGGDSQGGNQTQQGSDEQSGGADESSEEQGGEEAPTWDFGGAVVRVQGGIFNPLNEESKLDDQGNVKKDYTTSRDAADQVEKKYNIKIEYAKLNTDGYSTDEAILAAITNGEAHADIFCEMEDIMISVRDNLADIAADVDQLEMGNIYIEPASWNGKVYGFTYDNMGSVYVMAYSREFLKNIGMDKTPTDMFVEGKWGYEDCKAYLTELKGKLPDGTYPIAVHSNHWVSMAPAANGVVSIGSDGSINLADDAYVEALEFYKDLVNSGLAAPSTDVEIVEGGGIKANQPYGMGDMSGKDQANSHVLTMIEAWQYEYMLNDKGEWGIVPFPWGSKVTCSGDYKTLSEDYRAAQSIWTNVMVPKAEYRGAGAKDIPDIALFLIARDYCDLKNPDGAAVRHAAWEAESKGEVYENYGYTPGTPGHFSTEQDVEVFDWLHTRTIVDWGAAFNNNGVVRVNRNGYYVIAAMRDARSDGESFTAEGETNMKDLKLK